MCPELVPTLNHADLLHGARSSKQHLARAEEPQSGRLKANTLLFPSPGLIWRYPDPREQHPVYDRRTIDDRPAAVELPQHAACQRMKSIQNAGRKRSRVNNPVRGAQAASRVKLKAGMDG